MDNIERKKSFEFSIGNVVYLKPQQEGVFEGRPGFLSPEFQFQGLADVIDIHPEEEAVTIKTRSDDKINPNKTFKIWVHHLERQ